MTVSVYIIEKTVFTSPGPRDVQTPPSFEVTNDEEGLPSPGSPEPVEWPPSLESLGSAISVDKSGLFEGVIFPGISVVSSGCSVGAPEDSWEGSDEGGSSDRDNIVDSVPTMLPARSEDDDGEGDSVSVRSCEDVVSLSPRAQGCRGPDPPNISVSKYSFFPVRVPLPCTR